MDYMLFEMPTSVEILNHRWEQNRIKAWTEVFEQGIRSRETRITVDVPSTYDPALRRFPPRRTSFPGVRTTLSTKEMSWTAW